MTNKLKPCPMCGSGDIRASEHAVEFNSVLLECNDCGLSQGEYRTKHLAIEAWNTRSTDPLVDEMAEALGDIYKFGNDADISAALAFEIDGIPELLAKHKARKEG